MALHQLIADPSVVRAGQGGYRGCQGTNHRASREKHAPHLAAQQLKSGCNALVAAQRKRIKLIQELIAACEQGMGGQKMHLSH
jgi:hypothetical protein